MAAKHFMMYYHRGTGTFIVTEPRPWSKENQNLFPEYDFVRQYPTTNLVETRLINEYGFRRVVQNDEVVLIQNLDTTSIF